MDRPEDRPNCLNWLVGGNVFPGYVLLILCRFLFAHTCQQNCIFIVIYVVGLGDGLAEPVGVNFGVNKYMASSTVFLSAVLFTCIYYNQFANFEQFIWSAILL